MIASLFSDNAHNRRPFGPARRRFLAAVVLVPSLLMLSGCGETQLETFPVTGTLKFDGKAPTGATLVLHPLKLEGDTINAAPNARVKADGTFSVSSYKPGDGAPPGEYAVTVEWHPVGDEGAAGPNVIPVLYGSPATSPIKVTIKAGAPTQLDPIVLTSEKTARAGVAGRAY